MLTRKVCRQRCAGSISENEALRQRLDTELATNATLRDRIDALHVELRQSTEHYAQQIKDAVAEAERRVKPMLVELDSLAQHGGHVSIRACATRAARNLSFIQQIAAAKARGDRLDAQLREQSDEVDALTKEVAVLRAQQGIDPAIASLLCSLVEAGRLDERRIERDRHCGGRPCRAAAALPKM